jgi:hypothetical protein
MVNVTTTAEDLQYVLEVYVDNFISCIIPTSRKQIKHVARGILQGIHNVFPPSADKTKDPIFGQETVQG